MNPKLGPDIWEAVNTIPKNAEILDKVRTEMRAALKSLLKVLTTILFLQIVFHV